MNKRKEILRWYKLHLGELREQVVYSDRNLYDLLDIVENLLIECPAELTCDYLDLYEEIYQAIDEMEKYQ